MIRLLLAIGIFYSVGASAQTAQNVFPVFRLNAIDMDVRKFPRWQTDLRMAKNFAKAWYSEFAEYYNAGYEAKYGGRLPRADYVRIVNSWMQRIDSSTSVTELFPGVNLDFGPPPILTDLDLLLIKAQNLSHLLAVGRNYPLPYLRASSIPAAPYKNLSKDPLVVWRHRMKEFIKKYSEMYADQFSEMRRIPREIFLIEDIQSKIGDELREVKDYSTADAMESGNLRRNLRSALETRANDIDRSGYVHAIDWFTKAKEALLAQFIIDEADQEALTALEARVKTLEDSTARPSNESQSEDVMTAQTMLLTSEDRIKRVRIVLLVGLISLVALIVRNFRIGGAGSA